MQADVTVGMRFLEVDETGLAGCRPGDTWLVVEHVMGRDWTCRNERTGERAVWCLPDEYLFVPVHERRLTGEHPALPEETP